MILIYQETSTIFKFIITDTRHQKQTISIKNALSCNQWNLKLLEGTVIIEFQAIKGFGFACKDVTKVDENNFLKTCHFVIIQKVKTLLKKQHTPLWGLNIYYLQSNKRQQTQ